MPIERLWEEQIIVAVKQYKNGMSAGTVGDARHLI
jgi:hypothetical protein